MLDKEFDQYFRDRLLDHPSKVHLSMWKRVHTHLLHKAFHFWKWYVVGPTAVVVAVTGHFILSAPHPTVHTTKTAAVATYDSRPVPDSAATSVAGSTASVAGSTASVPDSAATSAASATTTLPPNPGTASAQAAASSATAANPTASSATTSSATTANPTAGSPTAAGPTPATTGIAATTGTATTTGTAATTAAAIRAPRATKAASSTSAMSAMRTAGITHASASTKTSTATRSTTRYHPSRHNPRSAGDRTATRPTRGSHGSGLAGAHNHRLTGADPTARGDADALTLNAPHPPVPAQLTAPAKLVTLKTPPAVAVKTPNSKSPHQLTLPARPEHKRIPLQLDVFGGPEHFTWNTIGLSFGAGAQLTLVIKNHWTLTSGLQYQRINVNHVGQVDSISGLLPGYFSNLQIPLLFGYTMGNDRYSLAVKAGPLWNLGSQAHKSLANADNWPNHSWNAYLGINFSSRVTNKISLFAEPYVRCWFPPGDIRLPPQLWSTGLMLGIRYNF